MATAMVHAPHHELRHDEQSRANFSYFITHDRVREDLNKMVRGFVESVKTGDFSEYLLDSQQAFDDPIAVDYERVGTMQRIEDQAQFLREVGIAPASFANITYTRLGAIVRKMDARRRGTTNFFNKMYVPASNAFLGAAVTRESLEDMGGLEFNHDRDMTFFDSRFGIVMPADRFHATYDLHGGWDLDDSVGIFMVKIYCSDVKKRNALRKAGVLDPALVCPKTAAKAVTAGLMIRRPNGPGEYSIEKIDEDMPWVNYDADSIEVVDLADAPDDIDTIFARSEIAGVPTSLSYDGEFTRRVAAEMVEAQVNNPSVGGFANALMAWVSVFGHNSVPEQLIGRMEDVVDATQQTSDALSFDAIRIGVEEIWSQFVDKMLAEGATIDKAMLVTRVPTKVGDNNIHEQLINAGLVVEGEWSRVQKRYNLAIDHTRKLATEAASKARLDTDLARIIRGIQFGPEYKAEVEGFFREVYKAFKKTDREHRKAVAEIANPVIRRQLATQRRTDVESLMDRIVNRIQSKERVDSHKFVLALYKHMITPTNQFPNGHVDRVLVQPSSEGHTSMLQLFIEALEVEGVMIDLVL